MEGDTMLETRTAPSVKPAPVETVTPIKPSEAIRLGCLTSLPRRGDWFDWDEQDRLEACAMGAMYLGWGDDPNGCETPERAAAVNERVMSFDEVHLPCPGGSCEVTRYMPEWRPPASEVVMHLNDSHEWSRERIADWLEGLGL